MGKEKNVKVCLPGGSRVGEECSRQLFMDSFTRIQLSWLLSEEGKILQLFILIGSGINASFLVILSFLIFSI